MNESDYLNALLATLRELRVEDKADERLAPRLRTTKARAKARADVYRAISELTNPPAMHLSVDGGKTIETDRGDRVVINPPTDKLTQPVIENA